MTKRQKYIFVTGGVLSGVGKGITAASIGALLQAKGVSVSIQKCDPYLNTDVGRLDPREHGEVFVTTDGTEADLDLGHYERFLDIEMSHRNTTLSGNLLLDILNREQRGEFKGKTVQLVPHLTDAIQRDIIEAAEGDVHIVEIGGTVGDYEGLSFIEAIREHSWKVGRENCLFIHVVYVPFIGASKEFKTKPAQNALADLRSFGIMPDAAIVRSDDAAPEQVRDKIALFGGLPVSAVQLLPNVDTVFRIPELLAQNGIHTLLSDFTDCHTVPDLTKWQQVIARQTDTSAPVLTVGLVVQMVDNEDVHLSVAEALRAAAWSIGKQVAIRWIDLDKLDLRRLEAVDVVVMSGRDSESQGKNSAQVIQYVYKNKKPYLGIGQGFEAVVQQALQSSGVFELYKKPRVGGFQSELVKGSQVAQAYGESQVTERHRHSAFVSSSHTEQLKQAGLAVSGLSADGKNIEFIEATGQPFFVATVAAIQYTSRPYRAHPLFKELLSAVNLQKS